MKAEPTWWSLSEKEFLIQVETFHGCDIGSIAVAADDGRVFHQSGTQGRIKVLATTGLGLGVEERQDCSDQILLQSEILNGVVICGCPVAGGDDSVGAVLTE